MTPTPEIDRTEAASCVVTGAASGLGRGIAAWLVHRGWHVVGLDLNDSSQREVDISAVIGDVALPSAHQEAADWARGIAPLRGWVNCAGFNILGSVTELSEPDLRRGVDVNLLGVFHGTAAAARAMLDHDRLGGSIVNISSMQARIGFPGFAAYAMTKGGIEALSRQVAAEYIHQGIRCNVVAPGLIDSPMNEQLLRESSNPELQLRRWAALTPMGRWGTAKDIAPLCEFLLGEHASYITGEVFDVNGGALAIAPGQLEQ